VGGLFAQFVFGLVQPVAWIMMVFNFAALGLAVSLLGIVGSGLVSQVAIAIASEHDHVIVGND
ncbi:MAG: hypothetical protein ACFFFC_09850, partial [Candidatus Thorarchaeota archaeon]